ncbi:MAG: AAA family ATPase [Planctomycetes bacterium]|nr:AAA family ATPase [Planctomycetota bacterium]
MFFVLKFLIEEESILEKYGVPGLIVAACAVVGLIYKVIRDKNKELRELADKFRKEEHAKEKAELVQITQKSDLKTAQEKLIGRKEKLEKAGERSKQYLEAGKNWKRIAEDVQRQILLLEKSCSSLGSRVGDLESERQRLIEYSDALRLQLDGQDPQRLDDNYKQQIKLLEEELASRDERISELQESIEAAHRDFDEAVKKLKLIERQAEVTWEEGLLAPKFEIQKFASIKRSVKFVAFVNHKGGVGKTTLCYNLGHAYSVRTKKRVLLIDLDPQGNLTSITLGDTSDRSQGASVSQVMSDYFDGKLINLTEFTSKSRHVELVDIIPASKWEMSFEGRLVQEYFESKDGREPRAVWMDTFLNLLNSDNEIPWDLVLFDCPPSFSMITQSALTVADLLIVPTPLSDFVLDGVDKLKQGAFTWRTGFLKTNPVDVGIVLNRIKVRSGEITKDLKPIFDGFKAAFPDELFPDGAWIPSNDALFAAQMSGPLILNLKKTPSTEVLYNGIEGVYREFLKRLKKA